MLSNTVINIDFEKLTEEIAQKVARRIKPLPLSNESSQDTLFTVKSLSEFLEVSPQWIYDRVRLNKIPFYKDGKFLRFSKSKIIKWLDTLENPVMPSRSKLRGSSRAGT